MITIDTNVLIYAFDDDEPVKQLIAAQVRDRLVANGALVGLQVIGECQNVLQRKLRRAPWEAATAARNLLHTFVGAFPPTERAVEDALAFVASGRLSYWDALLLGSARDAGCTTMISEDMDDGSTVLSIRVVNPFSPDGTLSEPARELLA